MLNDAPLWLYIEPNSSAAPCYCSESPFARSTILLTGRGRVVVIIFFRHRGLRIALDHRSQKQRLSFIVLVVLNLMNAYIVVVARTSCFRLVVFFQESTSSYRNPFQAQA